MRKGLIILIFLVSQKAFTQLTYQNLVVDYDSAWTYKNLKLIPIRYKGPGYAPHYSRLSNTISFNQAMNQGIITVQERGTASVENVHWLSLYNNSDKDVFISSGEVLSGGRQDRMVSRDTLVIAKSGRIDLPVMCVEEGRWTEKDKKFVYQRMANTHLRKILDQSKNQVLIWKEINNQLERDKIKNKTYSYLSRQLNKNYSLLQQEYLRFFKTKVHQPDSNVIGMVCVTGDKILGTDIFINSRLFLGQWQPMAMGYIEEAIIFGGPPTVPDRVVKKYLDQFLVDEAIQEEFVKKNGKLFKIDGRVIHLTTY